MESGMGGGNDRKDSANDNIPESSPAFEPARGEIQARSESEILAEFAQLQATVDALLAGSPDAQQLDTARALLLNLVQQEKSAGVLADDMLRRPMNSQHLEARLLSLESALHDASNEADAAARDRMIADVHRDLKDASAAYFAEIADAYTTR